MGLQLPSTISLSLVAVGGVVKSGNAVMPANLQWLSQYSLSSVMPAQLVRPAPASATIGFYSADHYGYPGQDKEIRICIQGGSFPYHPVAVSLPSGATLGTDPRVKADYMILRFTCPMTPGTQNIKINVFDNVGTLIPINYTFTTTTEAHVFVSGAGNDTTGTGTKAAPWRSINKAFADTTGGKILILEGGFYGDTSLGKTLSSTTINSMIAWTPHTAEIDYAANVETALGVAFNLNSPNPTIQGIVFSNPQNQCQSPRTFSSSSPTHYTNMDNCIFNINGRSGTTNIDNVSCIFLADPGTPRSKFSQTRCQFTGFAGMSNGWSAFDTYRTTDYVIEDNYFRDQVSTSDSAGIIWPKGVGCKNIDIRGNVFEDVFGGSLIDIYMSNAGAGDGETGNVDVSFNIVRAVDRYCMGVARADQLGARLPVWSRRNTFIGGGIFIFDRPYDVTFTSESDVIVSTISSTDPWKVVLNTGSGGAYSPLSAMPSLTYSIINYECHQNSGVVDAEGLLTGDYLQYRGRRGHEVWKP